MARDWPEKLFVAGTDTGVGKTLVCAVLTAGLRADYWKPVQSGLDEPTDTEWVYRHTGLGKDHFHPETYRLTRPLSPHAAAEQDGIRIRLNRFRLPRVQPGRSLVVEGAGGVMAPLNRTRFMLDLMKRLELPILLTARSTLGTINHTLLSLEQLRRHGLAILGVVMNGPRNEVNRKALEHYGKTRVLAEIEPLPRIDASTLTAEFRKMNSKPHVIHLGHERKNPF
ncbi:MAG: dethiobiotin synthase [Thermodesulfobacteriota bacterium]